jgi:hypothetical protein
MIKVGDRVTVDGDERIWIVEKVEEANDNLTGKDVYSGKVTNLRISRVKKTFRNPVVFLETFGNEWKKTVLDVLTKNKVKFKTMGVERRSDICRIFVDSKKVAACKELLDAHYKSQPI